jgi:hypothetical protein
VPGLRRTFPYLASLPSPPSKALVVAVPSFTPPTSPLSAVLPSLLSLDSPRVGAAVSQLVSRGRYSLPFPSHEAIIQHVSSCVECQVGVENELLYCNDDDQGVLLKFVFESRATPLWFEDTYELPLWSFRSGIYRTVEGDKQLYRLTEDSPRLYPLNLFFDSPARVARFLSLSVPE